MMTNGVLEYVEYEMREVEKTIGQEQAMEALGMICELDIVLL